MATRKLQQGHERTTRVPKHMREGASGVNRADYPEEADYQRALYYAGGPGPNEEFSVSSTTREGAITAGVYGRSHQEMREVLEAEARRQLLNRPDFSKFKL